MRRQLEAQAQAKIPNLRDLRRSEDPVDCGWNTWNNQASGMNVSGDLRGGLYYSRKKRGGARRHLERGTAELLGFSRGEETAGSFGSLILQITGLLGASVGIIFYWAEPDIACSLG